MKPSSSILRPLTLELAAARPVGPPPQRGTACRARRLAVPDAKAGGAAICDLSLELPLGLLRHLPRVSAALVILTFATGIGPPSVGRSAPGRGRAGGTPEGRHGPQLRTLQILQRRGLTGFPVSAGCELTRWIIGASAPTAALTALSEGTANEGD